MEGKEAWMAAHKLSYRKENWKRLLFPDSAEAQPTVLKSLSLQGFIAEKAGVITAFATIGISPQTHNGYLDYGHDQDCDHLLKPLLERCEEAVKAAGGMRLYRVTGMPLGQIRNDQITLWESYGFTCNLFYHLFVDNRNIALWNPPETLDLTGIQVPARAEIAAISTLLEEDREYFLAEEFRGNFAEFTPDHVFLCLYDDENRIKGISFYKVWEKKGDFLASAFGVHFRPKADVSRIEIRRLIQATLASMQQIGITAAWSRVSSQSFHTILTLAAEGFELSPNHDVMMVKPV
jgi:hypothetical protein